MNTIVASGAAARTSSKRLQAFVAALFGTALFLTAGFAWPDVVHNATHDTRHSLGLPCH